MDSNQGNIIINPFIARRGVEPRKDIMPNIRQSLTTLVLSSSNAIPPLNRTLQSGLVLVPVTPRYAR
jgi:hypothetical protein